MDRISLDSCNARLPAAAAWGFGDYPSVAKGLSLRRIQWWGLGSHWLQNQASAGRSGASGAAPPLWTAW